MGRRLTSVVLALGVLLLLVAPVLRMVVAPMLAQAPRVPGERGFLNHVSTGTITTLFDLESGTAAEPIAVTRTETTRGDGPAALAVAGDGLNVAVSSTLDRTVTADGRLIAEVSYRLAADRHSQALADCCGASVAGVSPPMAGAGNPLRLPWFTPEATYPYFDVTLLAPVEMAYLGLDRVADIDAMKFQQATPPTPVGTVPVPGRLVGSEQETVGAERTYAATRTLWVDPTTGLILRRTERVREALRLPAGREVLTLLAMTLSSTPEQVQAQVAAAHDQGRPVVLARTVGPVASVALGVLLLLVGLVSLVVHSRRQRVQEDFPDQWATFDDLREAFD